MVAQAVRRAGLSLAFAAAALSAAAQDAGFLDGAALARQLSHNLVLLAAEDIGEHGFGLVVGADATSLWVVTARHVVVHVGMRGSGEPERPSRRIRARLCGDAERRELEARPWDGWDAGGQDVQLLLLPRPAGYQPLTRALAPATSVGEAVWLLGSNTECAPVPAQGQIRSLADAAGNLRIDFAAVQGGSSGAPLLTGHGVIGLMKSAEDLTTTVHDIADLERRVRALADVRWGLEVARNWPPGDPRAAQIDLAETLNQYLFALRNVHMLLQREQVARPTLEEFVKSYNAAVTRFMQVREKHDGSLAQDWPPTTLPAWRTLRDELWAIHLNFWRSNAEMGEIYRSQQGSAKVRAQMQALEPDLQRLEQDMAQFLRQLAKEK
jgi:hypothetical protein